MLDAGYLDTPEQAFIEYPASNIQHRISSIEYPASSIQHPARLLGSSLSLTFKVMSTLERAVGHMLDALHSAAAKADFERYFDCFTSDAVFLGTDASERWELEAFKVWAKPYFDRGHGWTYAASERSIVISKDGYTAWFDERLENASLGECRGSGVLVREGESWKIAQYHLALPIPNDLIGSIVGQIRAAGSGADATRGPELP